MPPKGKTLHMNKYRGRQADASPPGVNMPLPPFKSGNDSALAKEKRCKSVPYGNEAAIPVSQRRKSRCLPGRTLDALAAPAGHAKPVSLARVMWLIRPDPEAGS